MTISIHDQVELANRDYYEAFEARDLVLMMDQWSSRDDIVCIPPFGEAALGWRAVEKVYRDTFRVIGESTVEMEVLRVSIEDPIATVSCSERIFKADGTSDCEFLATNVYLLEREGWRIIHHHASWRTIAQTRMFGVDGLLDED